MRRSLILLLPALSLFATGVALAAGVQPVSPVQAPRADARVLQALNAGADEVRVIIGVRDGTPSAHTLALSPDPGGEPARRIRRLEAQGRIASEIPEPDFRVARYYENFSLLAGTASRAAILAIANRPDVDWVTIDGTKHALATPQSSQVLIHSDQANAAGFTGTGQTIAVLDTGVDYTLSVLGGGGFPNAKVVGGTDIADHDADPMDCEGHGTSVAAVAAGPTGVAPGASIVAVKVFSSKDATNGSCQTDAQDSDILAGVNWAISNREMFGIGVINLSLGGAFSDTADHGYCDAGLPDYAAAFDSAVASGIVVVVASGNDGTSNAIAAPACVSSAISVGAVYSDNRSSVSWDDGKGGVQCTDTPVTPDEIVCFSDSSTALSLLAPGAFWVVGTKGHPVGSFSGTSAACPAAAGAAALLRQARPGISPAGVAGILRETGVPVTDSRNGIVTPRLDTLAVVSVPATAFFAFLGSPASIPDGNGSASASVTVAGFNGSVSGLQVLVEIEHSDPEQLRVTLTGPDGASVVLHDQTGLPEHPINAVYGRTDASDQPLTAFDGHPANGVWTLTVEDKVSGVTGRIRNFAVLLEPAQLATPLPKNVSGRVLTVISHSQGTKFFQSDVRVYNPSETARDFSLYFVPAGASGSQASLVTSTIGPGQVLAMNDVIQSAFGFSNSFGPVFVTSTDSNFLASGHNYTHSVNGNFGMTIPSASTTPALGFGGGTATANGLLKDAGFHSNVGFTEVSGDPVSVRVDVVDETGTIRGSTTIVGAPNSTPVMTDVVGLLGLGAIPNFRADFTVTSATGRIVPFATYVDGNTGDSVYFPAQNPGLSGEDVILTSSAHVTGANSQFFQTALHVTNVDSQPVTITVSLIPNIITGTPGPPRTYTLQPGQTLEKLDVLASEFGLADPSAAGLRIHPDHPTRLVVSDNTLTQRFGGTTGFSISGVSPSSAIGPGQTATAIQLDHATATTGSRCNFGVAEVSGSDLMVRVTARSGDTGAVLGTKDYYVPPNTLVQTSTADVLGAGVNATNFYLQYTVIAGKGRILPYAIVADNSSGDGIYVPAE